LQITRWKTRIHQGLAQRASAQRAYALLAVLLLAACAARAPALPAPEDALPADGAVSGWQAQSEPTTYSPDTLYDFMDGAADLYFTYGFESLAVGRYRSGDGTRLQVEVYRTASDADAYGLFTYNSYGEPVDLGVDGELESGYRLAFWQSRTFVQIAAREQVDDAALRAFAGAVSSALPEGGQRPSLVGALPAQGLQPRSARFFRQKMALDNVLWLGSEDVLGLDRDTEGVVARYARGGQDMDLLLVTFPSASQARQAHDALLGAGVEELAAAGVQDKTVGAVFCPACQDEAQALLDQALAALP
jgi:hypothetical protein